MYDNIYYINKACRKVKEMKRILWISPFAPYDKVGHAGGKAENFFVKGVFNSAKFDLYVITCYRHREKEKLDLDVYGIKNMQYEFDPNIITKVLIKLINAESVLSPMNRHAGLLSNYTEILLKKGIRCYAREQGQPDVVVLEWADTVLMEQYVRRYFPHARILGIEEDVAYLGYERKIDKTDGLIRRWIARHKYHRLKCIELKALQHLDKIMVYSKKDANLLIESAIEENKILVASTYYDPYFRCQHKCLNKDILFYGAMDRPENYLSAIWFIEQVLPRLEDKECRFIVIGLNPHPRLQRYVSERVKVMGFVEDVIPYFTSSLCLAAPLLLGAGIKVKILEAMSAGLPVLTNSIGIEGIPAKDKSDYFHCETAEDYVRAINLLLSNEAIQEKLSGNGKKLIKEHFNKKESLIKLINMLEKM